MQDLILNLLIIGVILSKAMIICGLAVDLYLSFTDNENYQRRFQSLSVAISGFVLSPMFVWLIAKVSS
ncbi:hypothetical protein [Brevundimonas sp.]|uniref:hypothetical protein n=1 Tax=Brevundimonas sp. TaxID=1871086 RepID=UPI00289C8AF6|nr:hypothetical protein [Brevundimonas sp.]